MPRIIVITSGDTGVDEALRRFRKLRRPIIITKSKARRMAYVIHQLAEEIRSRHGS